MPFPGATPKVDFGKFAVGLRASLALRFGLRIFTVISTFDAVKGLHIVFTGSLNLIWPRG